MYSDNIDWYLQYGLKKKDPEAEANKMLMETEGRIGRKKKTPAELAAEANEESEEEDEFASKFSSLCCCMNFVWI